MKKIKVKKYLIPVFIFCFTGNVNSQCNGVKVLNDFLNGKIECHIIDSSIIHLNQFMSDWKVISSMKREEFELTQIKFYPDSTALIEASLGTSRTYIDPFITGIPENLSCSYESKLGSDSTYNLSVIYFDGEYLILKIKEKSRRKWKKKGYFLLERSKG
jgi:hypothetical protein